MQYSLAKLLLTLTIAAVFFAALHYVRSMGPFIHVVGLVCLPIGMLLLFAAGFAYPITILISPQKGTRLDPASNPVLPYVHVLTATGAAVLVLHFIYIAADPFSYRYSRTTSLRGSASVWSRFLDQRAEVSQSPNFYIQASGSVTQLGVDFRTKGYYVAAYRREGAPPWLLIAKPYSDLHPGFVTRFMRDSPNIKVDGALYVPIDGQCIIVLDTGGSLYSRTVDRDDKNLIAIPRSSMTGVSIEAIERLLPRQSGE